MNDNLKAALKAYLLDRGQESDEINNVELYTSSSCCNAEGPTLDINYTPEGSKWGRDFEVDSYWVSELLEFLVEYKVEAEASE